MLRCNYREGALGFAEMGEGLRASRLPKSQLSGLPKPLADPSSVPPPGVADFPAPSPALSPLKAGPPACRGLSSTAE